MAHASPVIGDISAAGVGSEHGSAAVVTTTAASGQWDAHTPAPGAHAAIPAVETMAAGATTPPGAATTFEPTMAFLSTASTPTTRRSPFADFKASPVRQGYTHEVNGPENRSSQRAASGASARAASAEPPGAPGHRRRSRSPYTNPSAFPGATDGRVTAAVKLLEDAIDGMEKQRADDRRWIENNARGQRFRAQQV